MTRREAKLRGFIWGAFTASLVLMGVLYLHPAKADIVTEFGAGYKLPRSTSVLLLEDCHRARIIETIPDRPDLNYRYASCGGDNPLFVGWPIAWQSDFSDVWSIRAGWFHLSHWFDGGKDRELHLDCACASVTFNWSNWREKRRAGK